MAAPAFGNPVHGRVGLPGRPDPASGFVITRRFGDASLPQYGNHDGLDVDNGGAPGDDILAMYGGRVYQAFYDANSGGAGIVRIDHGNGWTTGYAHMDRLYVKAGQTVTKGQRIGSLDSTGWVTGPHLHYDVTLNGVRKNPEPYLNPAPAGGAFWMHTYGAADYAAVINRRYATRAGARFRADTTTSSTVIEEYPTGTAVVPHAEVEGQAVAGDTRWFLAWLYADGQYRMGAFHFSTLSYSGPVESGGASPADVDAAEKAAADVVRDAGVAALNSAAKKYGA